MKFKLIGLSLVLIFIACKQPAGKFNFQLNLNTNWKMQHASKLKSGLKEMSGISYNDSLWIDVSVPGTVLNGLVGAGIYKDIYRDKNLEKIPVEQFDTSWFFRTKFNLEKPVPGAFLKFNGINYRANVWLNGKQIFDKQTMVNPFRQFDTNVEEILKEGENVLLVEVFPPKPGDFSIGFVDWNPSTPDKNMGISREVILYLNKGVHVANSYVEAKLDKDFQTAALYISTELTNCSPNDVKGNLRISGKDFVLNKRISLKKGEKKTIKLNPSEFKQLKINKPSLWWPHTLGMPILYNINVAFTSGKEIWDIEEIQFGIRKIESYFTPEGYRGIMVNGKKILIRGAGWSDDLTLNDSHEFIRNQLEYVKDMNLNTIRLEGFWGKDHELYRLCDELGILVMVGWSCHWEWESYLGKVCHKNYGGITSEPDILMMASAWKDQIVWLRNHPSIIAWLGASDRVPHPDLEKKYFEIFDEFDSTRIYIPSAGDKKSLAGPSGVKMRGPYLYVPPVYWYEDTLYGGAFGFNTETGPGAQVPPLESILKMISADSLWPVNELWKFHCGGNLFGKLDKFQKAIQLRYGEPKSIEEFAKKAQLLNYELMRPMFEAFSINRYKATGVIQWMLNSAWPDMDWQLFDWYLMPNGAYYGAKKAGQPLQAMYNYSNQCVYLVNDMPKDTKPLTIEIRVFDINSKLLLEKKITRQISANQSVKIYHLPEIQNLSKTYFLSLKIMDSNARIADNFYWLSTKKDVLDYQNSDWYYTPATEYADFTLLDSMEKGKVEYILNKKDDGEFQQFEINLVNKTDKIAFFIEAKIIDKNDGFCILPVLWSENYFTVLPGEKKILTARIRNQYLDGRNPAFLMDPY